jgi:hypothetical protein
MIFIYIVKMKQDVIIRGVTLATGTDTDMATGIIMERVI